MREIKFRAYVKPKEKVLPVYGLDFSNVAEWLVTIAACGDLECGLCLDHYEKEDVVIMQCTGLKDKNGVEIYEGDVVRFVDFDNTGGHRDDREYTGIVKYQSGIYEIWKNTDSEYYGADGAFILNHAWLQDDEFEVIGNIYENPELLN